MAVHLPDVGVQHRTIIRDLQIRFFCNLINHVQPEATDTTFNPEIDNFIDFFSNFRVIPIQIRLLYGKLVKIVLLHIRNPSPCRTAEAGFHVVWRHIFVSVPPDIVIMERIVSAFLCFQKPRMLIRGMV